MVSAGCWRLLIVQGMGHHVNPVSCDIMLQLHAHESTVKSKTRYIRLWFWDHNIDTATYDLCPVLFFSGFKITNSSSGKVSLFSTSDQMVAKRLLKCWQQHGELPYSLFACADDLQKIHIIWMCKFTTRSVNHSSCLPNQSYDQRFYSYHFPNWVYGIRYTVMSSLWMSVPGVRNGG